MLNKCATWAIAAILSACSSKPAPPSCPFEGKYHLAYGAPVGDCASTLSAQLPEQVIVLQFGEKTPVFVDPVGVQNATFNNDTCGGTFSLPLDTCANASIAFSVTYTNGGLNGTAQITACNTGSTPCTATVDVTAVNLERIISQ